MLRVTSALDHRPGGAPQELADPNNHRRTIYGIVKRRELNDLLRLHDFPDPTTHSAGRIPTTTALQQLFVLNSPFMQQQGLLLARRLQGEPAAGIRRAYLLLFARQATEREIKL